MECHLVVGSGVAGGPADDLHDQGSAPWIDVEAVTAGEDHVVEQEFPTDVASVLDGPAVGQRADVHGSGVGQVDDAVDRHLIGTVERHVPH